MPLRALATTTLPTREAERAVTLPAGLCDATWVSPMTGPLGQRTRRSPGRRADPVVATVHGRYRVEDRARGRVAAAGPASTIPLARRRLHSVPVCRVVVTTLRIVRVGG